MKHIKIPDGGLPVSLLWSGVLFMQEIHTLISAVYQGIMKINKKDRGDIREASPKHRADVRIFAHYGNVLYAVRSSLGNDCSRA